MDTPALDLSILEAPLAGLAAPSAPSDKDRSIFWDKAFTLFEESAQSSLRPKDVKRALLKWLATHCPWLPKTGASLRREFNRERAAWRRWGRTPAALIDRRAQANRARRKRLTKADRDRIVSTALSSHGGDYGPAWAGCGTKVR